MEPTNEIKGCIHSEKFSELPDEEMDSTKVENLNKSENFISNSIIGWILKLASSLFTLIESPDLK